MNNIKFRIVNVFLAAIYAYTFHYVYLNYVAVWFGRMNQTNYYAIAPEKMPIYIILSAFPIFFYNGLKTIAASFSLFTFLLAYIPIISSLFGYRFQSTLALPFSLTFFVAMICFFLTDGLFIWKKMFRQVKRVFGFKQLEILTWLCFIIVALINIGEMRFVDFLEDSEDLYELRGNSSIKGIYFLSWLRSALFPLLMVVYLRRGEIVKYSIIFIAYIIIFMLDKQKITFLFPFILLSLYHVVSINTEKTAKYFHLFLITLLVGVPLILMYNLYNPTIFAIATLVNMRTICIEGMECERYIKFFEIDGNPHTYFSHVNIVNFFTDSYPYPDSMGRMISATGGCSNATFWLMDGVGSGGIIGCIIISVIFILFKSIMNSISIKCNWLFCIIIMLFGIQSMLNLSLFTSINTCGFVILYLIFLFVDFGDILDMDTVPAKRKKQKLKKIRMRL